MDQPKPVVNHAVPTLDHWREAMSQLRHLSDDVWRGMKLLLGLNGFIGVALVALGIFGELTERAKLLVMLLSLLGIMVTLTARYILKRHRIYYLQMLAKKSVLEDELGFYRTKLTGSDMDLAFPWRVTPEVVSEIKQNAEAWVQKMIRAKGTIVLWQFLIYEVLLGVYTMILVGAVIRFLK